VLNEEADEAFEFGSLSVGDRYADDEVVLSAEFAEQDGPAGVQRHEQGEVVLLAEGLEFAAEVPRRN